MVALHYSTGCRALLLGTLFALGGCDGSANEPIASEQEEIIGGTPPSSQGALASYGVVSFGCTGTLLTNRHVLTAHHCTGRYNGTNWTGTLSAPGSLTVTIETPSGNRFSHNSGFLEPPGTWTLDASDYAIMTLDAPLSPNGSSDQFYNAIYSGTDASLLGTTVLCIGYGATFEATPMTPSGGYRLTSANMSIDLVGNGVLTRNRHNGVVGFGGDSGSTCFLNGKITGVQSTCDSSSYYDQNNNHMDDFWDENFNVMFCNSSAPSNFRSWVSNNVVVPANVKFEAMPPLTGGATMPGVVTTLLGTTAVTWNGTNTFAVDATRAGRVVASVTSEPANMMCPIMTTIGPMTGPLSMTGRCLSDALVATVTDIN